MAKQKAPQLVNIQNLSSGEVKFFLNLNGIDAALAAKNAFNGTSSKLIEKDTIKVAIFDKEKRPSGSTRTDVYVDPSNLNDRYILIDDLAFDYLPPGTYATKITITRPQTGGTTAQPPLTEELQSSFIFRRSQDVAQSVSLKPTFVERTSDADFWDEIISTDINFRDFKHFMDEVLCKPSTNGFVTEPDRDHFKNRLPFLNVDEYSLLKFATEAYMKRMLQLDGVAGYFGISINKALPYYDNLSETLDDILKDYGPIAAAFSRQAAGGLTPNDCEVRKTTRLAEIPMLELIWSYWMEQAMLVQSMGAISLRFQNIQGQNGTAVLSRFDTSPLRPLSNMLWGYIQDEQHRTTLSRRVFEYGHAYNLKLIGRAVPQHQSVDNRSNFLAAFHNLLHQASIFYKDFDDMTRRADGFPLLTSLREVHLLLAEGNHNAYQNLTWTARAEMLSMQYLLSTAEMRTFLGGRAMVPYPEEWMDKLDTMKTLQGWDNTSVLHYYDLARNGEKILLSIRYGDWTETSYKADIASKWAEIFRSHIVSYINAYRIVSGLDLSSDAARVVPQERAIQPALLIQRRLQANRAQPLEKVLVREPRLGLPRY